MKAKKKGLKAKGYYFTPDRWWNYFVNKFRNARKKSFKHRKDYYQ